MRGMDENQVDSCLLMHIAKHCKGSRSHKLRLHLRERQESPRNDQDMDMNTGEDMVKTEKIIARASAASNRAGTTAVVDTASLPMCILSKTQYFDQLFRLLEHDDRFVPVPLLGATFKLDQIDAHIFQEWDHQWQFLTAAPLFLRYSHDIWGLLLLLPTNEHMLSALERLDDDYKAMLDPSSPHRLLYALQIVCYLTENGEQVFIVSCRMCHEMYMLFMPMHMHLHLLNSRIIVFQIHVLSFGSMYIGCFIYQKRSKRLRTAHTTRLTQTLLTQRYAQVCSRTGTVQLPRLT